MKDRVILLSVWIPQLISPLPWPSPSGAWNMISADQVPDSAGWANSNLYRYLSGNGERHTNLAITRCLDTLSPPGTANPNGQTVILLTEGAPTCQQDARCRAQGTGCVM